MSGKPGDTARREAAALASLAALRPLGVESLKLDFVGEPAADEPIPARQVLTLDAPLVTGERGPRKPVISEMIDVLAADASARGIPRIGLVNGDILVLPAAIERLRSLDHPAVAISRTDVGGGAPETNLLYGIDMFVFDREFWQRERRRFRPYLLGEGVWDNVYASLVACHRGVLINRERLILHERHPSSFQDSPFARYVHLLAARDRSYFTLWCRYAAAADELRARAGSADEELALQREIFHPPGPAAEAMDIGRAAWWRAKRMLGA